MSFTPLRRLKRICGRWSNTYKSRHWRMIMSVGGDEIWRSVYGFLVCLPVTMVCSRFTLRPWQTSLALTLYMVPAWRLYSLLKEVIS
jgi:hypothetical protein